MNFYEVSSKLGKGVSLPFISLARSIKDKIAPYYYNGGYANSSEKKMSLRDYLK